MDFKQIETFISVAKYKSFSKAANAVFLSQPAVSSNVSSLEKELHIQLFDRTSKEVLLTPAGEAFLKYAIDIINTRNNAVEYLTNFNYVVSGTLSLAASTTPCNTIVPVLIKKFRKLYPDVCFNIMEQSSGEIADNITKFNYEIGIIGSFVNDEKINCFKMLDDELVIASNKELNLPDEIPLDSLCKYKFILREKQSATRKTFENLLKSNHFDMRNLDICIEANNLDSIIQLIKNGLGISVLSAEVLKSCSKAYDMKISRIKEFEIKRGLYVITSSKRTLTPTAKAFFDICKKYSQSKKERKY